MAARIKHTLEEKIQGIQEKINKKQEELKALRTQLNELEAKQNNQTLNEIVALMNEKGLAPETVLSWIRDYQPPQQG